MRYYLGGVGAFYSEIFHANSQYFILTKSSKKFFFRKIDLSVSLLKAFTYKEKVKPSRHEIVH